MEHTFMMSTQKRGRQWGPEICHVFVDSTVLQQQSYCLFSQIGLEGCIIDHFLWMRDPIRCLKDQLYTRSIFNNYRSICKFTATPCQTLRGDVKLRKMKSFVVQLRLSYQVNGPQKYYGHHRHEYRQLARESCLCRNIYFQKYNLKQNVYCNFCSKLQKMFQAPKIIFKADWLGVANNNYTF